AAAEAAAAFRANPALAASGLTPARFAALSRAAAAAGVAPAEARTQAAASLWARDDAEARARLDRYLQGGLTHERFAGAEAAGGVPQDDARLVLEEYQGAASRDINDFLRGREGARA